jgi:hypothetical protein
MLSIEMKNKMSEQKKKQTPKPAIKHYAAKTKPKPAASMGSESVRSRVLSYHKTAAQFNVAATEMIHKGILGMQAGVRDMQLGINEQRKKNAEGAAVFQCGVDEMVAAIAKHAQDTQAYIKQFIG